MATTEAVQLATALLQKADAHAREIVANQPPGAAEVDTINIILGSGVGVIATGVAGALRVDFRAKITGAFLQEIDGTTGSIVVAIAKAPGGATPSFTSIVASAPPTITSARFVENTTLTGWTTLIERGEYLRFSVTSVTSFTRMIVALRITRLEP